MDAACQTADRSTDSVRLVAVTKYADWEWVQALSAHHQVFGENRPQQLSERQPLLPDMNWHLIGQLQRNKAKLAVRHASMIHSVDSLRLLERVADVAALEGPPTNVLLQVNVSGEESKSGFTPEELQTLFSQMTARQSVSIRGLMTMAPATDDESLIRSSFAGLRQLRDDLSNSHGHALPELSMGMSGDFEIAIEEGATLVRIGSRLFQGLNRQQA